MQPLLITVGNIYIDQNIFGVNAGEQFLLESGKDYFADSRQDTLGGSAVNAALQARKLGLDVAFLGRTGADEGSRAVRSLLQVAGIAQDLMVQDEQSTTSMAVNLIDKRGEFIGVHHGDASRKLSRRDIDLSNGLFNRCKGMYFGGTAKQPLLFKDCQHVFKELSERGIRIFYDPNRFPASEEFGDRSLLQAQLPFVEGYFPNEEELLQATNTTDVDSALDQVIHSGVKFVALKLGARGCRVKTADQDFRVAGFQVQPITTVGAGDCFNATFIASYLKGSDLEECAKRATAAAAIRVSQNDWCDDAAITGLLENHSAS